MISISSGVLKGLQLTSPSGTTTRPTAVKVRQAVFNKLQFAWTGESCAGCDLFAGSGAMGLEMLSRGFAAATFVEESPAAAKILRENLAKAQKRLPPSTAARLEIMRSESFLKTRPSETFHLIWADPPYAAAVAFLQETAHDLKRALRPGGLFVLEASRRDLPLLRDLLHDGAWALEEKTYGDTGVLFAWLKS